MSAERLRQAADRLDALAGAATPGPWHVCDEPPADADSAVTDFIHQPVAVQLDEWYEVDPDEPTAVHDAAYIAAMHPPVGKAVAAWLRRVADDYAIAEHGYWSRCALAVADAILGGAA